MDVWIYTCMDVCMCVCLDLWMDGGMCGWTDGWTDGRMYGRMDKRIAGASRPQLVQQRREGHAPARGGPSCAHPLYGDLTTISPAIISNSNLISKSLISAPLAIYFLDTSFSLEIIVCGILVKSQYDMNPRTVLCCLPVGSGRSPSSVDCRSRLAKQKGDKVPTTCRAMPGHCFNPHVCKCQ